MSRLDWIKDELAACRAVLNDLKANRHLNKHVRFYIRKIMLEYIRSSGEEWALKKGIDKDDVANWHDALYRPVKFSKVDYIIRDFCIELFERYKKRGEQELEIERAKIK